MLSNETQVPRHMGVYWQVIAVTSRSPFPAEDRCALARPRGIQRMFPIPHLERRYHSHERQAQSSMSAPSGLRCRGRGCCVHMSVSRSAPRPGKVSIRLLRTCKRNRLMLAARESMLARPAPRVTPFRARGCDRLHRTQQLWQRAATGALAAHRRSRAVR